MATEFAIDALMQRLSAAAPEGLLTDYHEAFASPIWRSEPDADEQARWLPVAQTQSWDWASLENALEQPVPEPLQRYYERWFSADIEAVWGAHGVILLQVMGPEDIERLQTNLVGHILMKRRLRQPITFFIGLAADTDDLLITLDSETHAIGLEWVGQPQHEQLALSMDAFLAGLQLPTA